MSISSSDQANNSPREIEYENDLIDLDYLQEKFDEDDVIPKEIDEEAHLKNPHSLHNQDLDQNPPKTVKEEIANLKAKVKRKQQTNISSEEQSVDHSSVPNHLTDSAKEERLPIVSKKISSARSKIPSSSGHHPPSHPSDSQSGSREKSSHENKFPNLPTQRNKTHASQPKSLFKKRSNDAAGGVAAIASEEEDHLKSMEILKRREEEILRAKLKREKLLQEQAEYFPPSGYDPLAGMPGTSSSSKKTKKKKEAKEFLVKYDSRSGLFGVDVEAERQSRLENYRIQRKMKRNAEQAEIQRARVRLHRHGAYDLYNQGTVSFEGRDLFHERPPRPPQPHDEGGERLTSLSDRKERQEDHGDGDRSETKRSSSAENSPLRQSFHHHEGLLSHVSYPHNQHHRHHDSNPSPGQQQGPGGGGGGEKKRKVKRKGPEDQQQKADEVIASELKSPLFDFPDYLNDSPVQPQPQRAPKKYPLHKPKKLPVSSTSSSPSPQKRVGKDRNALDIFESEDGAKGGRGNGNGNGGESSKRREERRGKPKKKKKILMAEKSAEELEAEEVTQKQIEVKNEVMKQLDIEFPDYLLDTPSSGAVGGGGKGNGNSSPKRIRDLSRPTKASIASQAPSKPKRDEKDLAKKKKNGKGPTAVAAGGAEAGVGLAQKKIKAPPRPEPSEGSHPQAPAAPVAPEEKASPFPQEPPAPPPITTELDDAAAAYANDDDFEDEGDLSAPQASPPASLTPQPPSTERRHSFSRKSSSNSGSGSALTSPLPALAQPTEPSDGSGEGQPQLVISGTKLVSPLPAPASGSASGSGPQLEARFSPKTLRFDGEDDNPTKPTSPREGEGDSPEQQQEEDQEEEGKELEEMNAFLNVFEERTPEDQGQGQQEGEDQQEGDYDDDFIDPPNGPSEEDVIAPAAPPPGEGWGWGEEDVIGGQNEALPAEDGGEDAQGEGSHYEDHYAEDSFAPYESQGGGEEGPFGEAGAVAEGSDYPEEYYDSYGAGDEAEGAAGDPPPAQEEEVGERSRDEGAGREDGEGGDPNEESQLYDEDFVDEM